MNIPGFAAETSLYTTRRHYGSGVEWSGAAGMNAVYPAKILCEPTCTCDTYDYGVPGTCAKLCFDSPYGEAFSVECDPSACNPPCDKPICGKCKQTCHYPSGPNFTQAC